MISVIGSANMDLIARVHHLPAPGETISTSTFTYAAGGKGANQAVAAARAGSDVAFVGRVGDDGYGRTLVSELEQSGVSIDHVSIDPDEPTGLALITVDFAAENSIVTVAGANGRVTPDDVEAARGTITASDIAVLQLEIPLATVVRALQVANEAGTTLVLNPSPVLPLDAKVFRYVDVLVLNETEVAQLSGLGAPVEPISAATMLLGVGVGAVVVTLGARGCAVVSGEGETEISPFQVDAVDTTGAGDAFVGNLAHGLEGGMPLPDAARFACAAAALSVRIQGAQPSLPTHEQTQRLLKEHGP